MHPHSLLAVLVLSSCVSASRLPPKNWPEQPDEVPLSAAQQRAAADTIQTYRTFQACADTHRENDIAFTTECADMFIGHKVLIEVTDLSKDGRAFRISGTPIAHETSTFTCTLEFSDADEAKAQAELDSLASLKRRDLVVLEVGRVKSYQRGDGYPTTGFSACKYLRSE